MESLPPNVKSYKTTKLFSQDTVPAGLLRAHKTKAGTWGKIVVVQGSIVYRILEPELEEIVLDTDTHGVVEPQVLHEVSLVGEVQFYVDFHH